MEEREVDKFFFLHLKFRCVFFLPRWLPSSTDFYRVLPSFTEFYRVSLLPGRFGVWRRGGGGDKNFGKKRRARKWHKGRRFCLFISFFFLLWKKKRKVKLLSLSGPSTVAQQFPLAFFFWFTLYSFSFFLFFSFWSSSVGSSLRRCSPRVWMKLGKIIQKRKRKRRTKEKWLRSARHAVAINFIGTGAFLRVLTEFFLFFLLSFCFRWTWWTLVTSASILHRKKKKTNKKNKTKVTAISEDNQKGLWFKCFTSS